MVEHITGNIYHLSDKEKIIDGHGQVVFGPAMIRVSDFDDNLHALQIDSAKGEFRLEIQGELEDFVQEVIPGTNNTI
ncbi:MAG: hypothetical protein WC503_03495 [Candidatus Shapirobacteria bacterium]